MSAPGCLPAGVDPNRGSEVMVRSPGMLWPANGISGVIGGVLPVESTSQIVCTNGNGTKCGVPPRKAGGRREEAATKYQIRPEHGS